MKFNTLCESFQKSKNWTQEKQQPKTPKGLTFISQENFDEYHAIYKYESDTKLQIRDLASKKKYPFEQFYTYQMTEVIPGDGFLGYWNKQLRVDLADGYGIYANSTNGKSGFASNGYGIWEVYIFYTQSNGERMLRQSYSNKKLSEKGLLKIIFEDLAPSIFAGIRIGSTKENIIRDRK